MNRLSWLIYWADVLPSVSSFVALFAGLLTLLFGGLSVFFFFAKDETTKIYRFNDAQNFKEEILVPSDVAKAAKSVWWAPYAVLVSLLVWCGAFFVPEKETFYLIAASETGEEVLNTPEAAKLRGILNKWLDDQLAKTQEENQQQGG